MDQSALVGNQTPLPCRQIHQAPTLPERYRCALATLPPMGEWSPYENSDAWFSEFHFNGRDSFALPFDPDGFLFSPVVELPLPVAMEPGEGGAYRRGVRKYRNMLRKGGSLPPITILASPCGAATSDWSWHRQDGNHRWEAAIAERRTHIPAVFGYPEWHVPDLAVGRIHSLSAPEAGGTP